MLKFRISGISKIVKRAIKPIKSNLITVEATIEVRGNMFYARYTDSDVLSATRSYPLTSDSFRAKGRKALYSNTVKYPNIEPVVILRDIGERTESTDHYIPFREGFTVRGFISNGRFNITKIKYPNNGK